jgi:hypothetical protein
MVVNYDQNGKVCRIKLPAVGPSRDSGVISPVAIDDLIIDLLPPRVRGPELRKSSFISGPNVASTVEYENLVIAETLLGQTRTSVTITLKRKGCENNASDKR